MKKTQGRIFMDEEIKFDYFNWLVEWVGGETHTALLRHLHRRPFYWSVANDDNRAMDGQALRDRFVYETNYTDYEYPPEEASVLEMLIGLASRINDILIGIEEEDQTKYWFWLLLENINLAKYSDISFYDEGGIKAVDDILDRFLDRRYRRNGDGGLFPLMHSSEDQRNVELWYQMSAYLDENYDYMEGC